MTIADTLSARMIFASFIVAFSLGGWPPTLPIVRPSDAAATRPPTSVDVTQLPDGQWQCHFRLLDHMDAEQVSIAGDFNGWSPSPMHQSLGGWGVTSQLDGGLRRYKFIVDGQWMIDPVNPDREPDGYGGFNSLLRLGSLANVDPTTARLGDERIEGAAVQHNPLRWSDSSGDTDRRTLRLRTLAGDVEAVSLVQPWIGSTSMHQTLADGRFQWWEITVDVPSRDDRYTFMLHDGAVTQRFPEVHRFSETPMHLETPDWARDAIWYQIMVDRFRNGDPTTDPQPGRTWTSDWYKPALSEGADGQDFYNWYVFSRLYGGDITGLRSQLGYLKDLGVNALYLNPVFQSESHHKYNATSFVHIDEHYGGGTAYSAADAIEDPTDASTWAWTKSDTAFLDFLREAKSQGFRVIIDGVFNHVGTQHSAFQDVVKNGQSSPYADWFDVKSWEPFDYAGWAGFGELPVFAKNDEYGLASESCRQHIMDITRRWMDPNGDGDPSDGIDGWRLDVPNEVPMAFWIEWRKLVKSINPDALIVGEIWDNAEQWLDGRSFDAVMNYPFARASLDWIAAKDNKINASEVDVRFAELRMAYPESATYVMQNLLDSHDTDRVVSKIYNPDRPYDAQNREQEVDDYKAGKPPEWAYKRARLAALLQMMYVGAPMIYYGDEVGLWGSDDPNNRKPMLWEDLQPYDEAGMAVMPTHFEFFRRAIAVRSAYPALRRGSIETVLTDDEQDVWVFLRKFEGQEVLVALNAGEADAVVTLPSTFGIDWKRVLVEPEQMDASWPTINVPAVGGVVWVNGK
ncbi:MAG: alpha amylase N-terminal ig-like domain-containing protein [Phycisphaerales bacterium]|nr:alpha amylase N-terminal ig-like domain-containing protein [Phycisphaerales bacterium]